MLHASVPRPPDTEDILDKNYYALAEPVSVACSANTGPTPLALYTYYVIVARAVIGVMISFAIKSGRSFYGGISVMAHSPSILR